MAIARRVPTPVSASRRYRRCGRERFLSPEEMQRLGAVLSRHEPDHPLEIATIRLLLLTGCPPQRNPDTQMVRLPRGALVSARLQDRAEDGLAVVSGPRGYWMGFPGLARGYSLHGEDGVSFAGP